MFERKELADIGVERAARDQHMVRSLDIVKDYWTRAFAGGRTEAVDGRAC